MHSGPAAPERLHALDALRAVAMLLGIVLHAMMSFVVTPLPWPVHDPQRSFAFDGAVYLIHGFRMPLFFLLAGFFAHLLVARDGMRAFARQRALRIGVPFLAGLVLIVPLLPLIWWWADPAGYARETAARPRSLLNYPTAHLWFLEMLLWLYALAIAGRVLLHRAPRLSGMAGRVFDVVLRHPAKPLLLAVPTAGLLTFGPFVPEIERAGTRLLPEWQAVAHYGLFFATGWWLHGRAHLLDGLRRWTGPYLSAGVVCWLLVGAASQALARGSADALACKILAWFAAAVYAWAMTFAVIGLFLRFASAHRPWMRYLADASYWWYLWHLPIVMGLQAVVAPWHAPAIVKLAVIIGGAVALLWPSYHLLVRFTWVGRLLNGSRRQARLAAVPA